MYLYTLLILTIFLAGCTKEPEPKDYYCDSFILHLDTRQNIQDKYYKMYPEKNDGKHKILGFAKIDKNEIWVSYSLEVDSSGEPLPDFQNLGHEVFHVIKEKWHK